MHFKYEQIDIIDLIGHPAGINRKIGCAKDRLKNPQNR